MSNEGWLLVVFGILGIIGMLLASLLSVILTGWAVSLLWLWFMVPLGFASITNLTGSGIYLITALITMGPQFANKDNQNVLSATLGWMFVRPFMFLGFAYILFLVL